MTARGFFKTTSIVLGICVIAIVAIVYAAGALVDFNRFKPEMEKTATAAFGRPVDIAGNVGLGFAGFRPALKVHDVQVGAPGPVITLGDISVALPLHWPSKDNPWALFANVNNVRIDGKSYGDYGAPIRFYQDGFDIPTIHGKMGQTTLDGRVSYRAQKLAVRLLVKDLDYGRLAEGATGGQVRADIDLTASGAPDTLLKTLGGHVRLAGDKGQMLGDAVDMWAAGVLSSLLSGHEKETHVNCAIADFDVKDGVARSNNIVIDTQRVTVTGKGVIDFADGRIDMRFTPAPKEAALISLATPVTVKGPFDDIETKPDAGAVATKLGGLLLGAVNPAAALIPLVHKGTQDNNACAAYLTADKKGKGKAQ